MTEHENLETLLWDFNCRYRERFAADLTNEIPHDARGFTQEYAKNNKLKEL